MTKRSKKVEKQQRDVEKKAQEEENDENNDDEEEDEAENENEEDEENDNDDNGNDEDDNDDDDDEDEEEEEDDDDDDEDKERPSKKVKTNSLSAVPLDVLPVSTTKFGEKHSVNHNRQHPIIILLDQATLETVKNKRGVYELLNCDDHRDLCRKKLRKDPNDFRPDILHQELLAILDSPLNKAGHVKVYIQTKKHVLIDVNPSIRIPRTYKRFAGLMVQLLHKMKIKASSESTTLLRIIKNPFSQYLPPGTRCYGMSCKGKLYSPLSLASSILPASPDSDGDQEQVPPTCFIVGAMSTGHVTMDDHPYMETFFSISQYPLSGASALSRIAGGIEHYWGIV